MCIRTFTLSSYTQDYGQFGTDPCTPAGSNIGGSFRALISGTYDGKVIRYDPIRQESTILAIG